MNPFSFDAGVTIGGETGCKDGLKYIHNRMMGDSVREVRQAEYLPLLWLKNGKDVIRGGAVFLIPKG